MDEANFEADAFGFDPEDAHRARLEGADQTRRLGAELAERLTDGAFVGLVGNLGTGKTTLVRGLVDALDPEVSVRSPSYTLINVYRTAPPIIHADLYRLDSPDDLASTGYYDYAGRSTGILCVEWLDRIPAAWPGDGLVVEFEYADQARRVTLWGRGHYAAVSSAILRDMEVQI